MIISTDRQQYIIKYQREPVRGWVAEFTLPDGTRDITGIFKTRDAARRSIAEYEDKPLTGGKDNEKDQIL